MVHFISERAKLLRMKGAQLPYQGLEKGRIFTIWTQHGYLEPDAAHLATDREMVLQKFEELTAMLSIVDALPMSS